jgi:cytochrome c oxidase accessory protein FixG
MRGFCFGDMKMEDNTLDSIPLYEKRIPIVPRTVHGKFRNFKTGVLVLAYSVFFLLPWLRWHRENGIPQAVVFDVVGRRFYIFDLIVYPQNVFWLALLLFIAATFLFFATTLIGRAFCGYFCFQTLWTDMFMFVEKWVQGERPARLKLIKQPWNAEKILKLGATHFIWLSISFWTGLTFVLYFGYAPDLVHRFFIGQANSTAYFTVLALTLSTYAAAGFMREQICAYICPYGRFQSVMYEPATLAIAYDYHRGEGKEGRVPMKGDLKSLESRHAQGHGDCIDCGICVQVCPAGIDIRDGLQYRCISCGLCIDGCNEVMSSVGFPRGLIRYDSEYNIESGSPKPPHLSWKRLKVLGYLVVLIGMSVLLVVSVLHQTDMVDSVQQIRQPLFVQMSNGKIRNRYEVRLTNESDADAVYQISTPDLPAGALDLGVMQTVRVHSGESILVDVGVSLEPDQIAKHHKFNFVIKSLTNPKDDVEVIPSNFSSELSAS